ncbi:VanW family protein [Bacillus sp. REN3]|uniref:VanW family protein n=1 Tax=Bacillus sp. REN3 TaxID=2802440 RepID=UPI001AEEA83E|nr:VanW family protein [Bacillus sp. REN3]
MSKFTLIALCLFSVCVIGLAGCSMESEAVEETDRIAVDHPGKSDAGGKILEERKPVVVSVIHPVTGELVKSLSPDEMGFGRDDAKYRKELQRLARELARGDGETPGFDTRLIPDKLGTDGKVIKGSPMTILEEKEFVEKVLEASLRGGEVELPLYITASGYKTEDAAHLAEQVVAKYTTYFNPSVAGRTKNIELSAEAINNVILGVGDYFSFNTTVGPSDAAHGYQPAEEIVNKKLVMGIGGGICQTSSTLYNAVDALGVGYIEKHHHSLTVGYVPKGRDATVSYGGKDFRFENTTGVPLLLKAIVGKGTLTVEVRTSRAYAAIIKKGV